MDGVTVLQTIPETLPCASTDGLISVLIIFFLFFAVCLYAMTQSNSDVWFSMSILSLLVCVGIIYMLCAKHPTRYKVTLNNNASYNEFTDNYKIIETEGNVLTVEERKGE